MAAAAAGRRLTSLTAPAAINRPASAGRAPLFSAAELFACAAVTARAANWLEFMIEFAMKSAARASQRTRLVTSVLLLLSLGAIIMIMSLASGSHAGRPLQRLVALASSPDESDWTGRNLSHAGNAVMLQFARPFDSATVFRPAGRPAADRCRPLGDATAARVRGKTRPGGDGDGRVRGKIPESRAALNTV